ncbi:hypothetical protein [Rubinisphaera sp.]|uniref:hypothetical protein n=1 Tax=Rubinisphaera sp. TaxID=2024857 RepID=UPI0025F37155|nr:hypothetical protein [Rubinisphaera sp.]
MQRSTWQVTTLTIMTAIFPIVLAGCGGSDDSYQGPTGTVSGIVKLDGSPLTEKANITFLSSEGFVATGQTDSSGNFTLTSKGSQQIPVGKYNVAVAPAAPAGASDDPSKYMDADGNTIEQEVIKTKIPASASNPGASGITKEVTEGEQKIEIELKS